MSSRRPHFVCHKDILDSLELIIAHKCRISMKYNTHRRSLNYNTLSRKDNGESGHFEIFNNTMS